MSDSNQANNSETENYSVEIAKLIYTSLRTEILEKMKFSNQIVGYKLLSVGAIIGFISVNYKTSEKFFVSAAIIVSVGLAVAFDLALYQNNKAIISVGTYMKENIEPWLKDIAHFSNVMWEEFLASQVQPSKRRKTYNWFESANYFMTILIAVLSIVYLWNFNMIFSVICMIILGFDLLILYNGLNKY